MKQVVILLAVIVLGIVWIQYEKSQVTYSETSCPMCGSEEVLDLGSDQRGNHCRCYSCKQDFYVHDYE